MESRPGCWKSPTRMGIDESFCPVRAMLGAFVSRAHFPIPDLLDCSVGATCDDFTAIAQRLAGPGASRSSGGKCLTGGGPEPASPPCDLPGGFRAPASQVALVRSELERVRAALESLRGQRSADERLAAGIARANRVRQLLGELRRLGLHGRSLPAAGLGDAHRRDAGDPFLLGPGRERSPCWRICWRRSRPARQPARACLAAAMPCASSGSIRWPTCG